MKIAFVTETFLPSTDGIVTRLCATIQLLKQEGHEVLVIAPDLGVTEWMGVQVKGVSARPFFLYRQKQLSFPSRIVKQYLQDFQPDIIHVVNPALLGVAGIYYGVRGNWPIVASYHTRIPEYAEHYRVPFLKPALWWYLRTLHNRASLNLCTSQTIKQELTIHGFKQVQVWNRGVDRTQFGAQYRNEPMRRRLTRGVDKVLLLYVGRLASEKQINKIRDALTASDRFCLAIVGDGPERSFLEEYFKGTDTVFTGFLHGKELAEAYASADVFVFPSTTETLGLVLLEAMASGLPVVAARSGPTCEQVEDQVNGILFDSDAPNGFVEAVLKLKEPGVRNHIAKTAMETVEQFSWQGPTEQLVRFYKQVISNGVQIKAISKETNRESKVYKNLANHDET